MTYSVHRIHYASVRLSGQYNPPSFEDTRIEVFGYLALSSQIAIVIDTGVGWGNDYIDRTFEPDRNSIEEQLSNFGVSVNDVAYVVNSHLHFDHCGNNRLFTNAHIVIQSHELDAAASKNYTVNDWFDYEGARLQVVSGETEIADGVRVLPTPGHTPGHQSVYIAAAEGNILVAAQSAFAADEYVRGGDPEVQAHDSLVKEYCDSILRLKSLSARKVLFSHDDAEVAQGAGT